MVRDEIDQILKCDNELDSGRWCTRNTTSKSIWEEYLRVKIAQHRHKPKAYQIFSLFEGLRDEEPMQTADIGVIKKDTFVAHCPFTGITTCAYSMEESVIEWEQQFRQRFRGITALSRV